MRLKLRSLRIILLLLLTACTSSQQAAQLPTLAALPSLTPTFTATPTETLTPSVTPSPTVTETPNQETLVAQGDMTNQVQLATLDALWTAMASSPTYTPTTAPTLTPSLTITNTVTPTITPRAVIAMQSQLLYVRSLANLRTCARTECERVAQLQERDTVMASGTTQGEAVNGGNALWYRVDYGGRQLYIYSNLVSDSPPTRVPPTRAVSVFSPPAPTSCTYDSLGAWRGVVSAAMSDMYSVDVASIQAAQVRFASTAYPDCAASAYQYVLMAFDEAIQYRQAMDSGDYTAASTHINNQSALTTAYFDEYRRISDIAFEGWLSSYGSDSDYGGSYRWEPGIEYQGSGYAVTCRDGSISYSGGRRGACSGHGGIAR